MKKIDISKITTPLIKGIDKVGKLSKLYRALISLGIILVFAGPLVYFSYIPKMEKIDQLNQEIETLDNKLARLRAKVRQLAVLKKKYKAAETKFKVVRKKLPEKKEIPTLLASISSSGQDAGLEFLLFQPKQEKNKEFFAEIPVSIQVTGSYHNVALFFDKVSRLSRIVNVDNIKLNTTKAKKGGLDLQTSCTAITYRFIEKKGK